MVGKRKEMRPQLGQRHGRPHRCAVVQNVETVLVKIDDTPSAGNSDVRVTNVPFLRHSPIEYRRPAGDLEGLERNSPADQFQGLPNPVAGDAPADWEHLRGEAVQ